MEKIRETAGEIVRVKSVTRDVGAAALVRKGLA
jgi:hypothetical protein